MAHQDSEESSELSPLDAQFKILYVEIFAFFGHFIILLLRQLFCQFKKGFAEVFSFGGAFGAASDFRQNPQMWSWLDSNQRPFECESNALAN